METNTSYYVWLHYEGEIFSSLLDKNSVECEDFKRNYVPETLVKNDLASDGIRYSRAMFVGGARMLHALFVSYTTSIAETNDDTGFITIRLRDENRAITTNGDNAVYTEIDFCPGKGVAYGLYGGGLETMEDTYEDISGWSIIAPDIPQQYGGHIITINNRIFNKPREKFFRNAINVGDLPGDPDGINILRMLLKHGQGVKVKVQAEIQYYI